MLLYIVHTCVQHKHHQIWLLYNTYNNCQVKKNQSHHMRYTQKRSLSYNYYSNRHCITFVYISMLYVMLQHCCIAHAENKYFNQNDKNWQWKYSMWLYSLISVSSYSTSPDFQCQARNISARAVNVRRVYRNKFRRQPCITRILTQLYTQRFCIVCLVYLHNGACAMKFRLNLNKICFTPNFDWNSCVCLCVCVCDKEIWAIMSNMWK